jgi:AmmeMemoRadiSam system protein B
MAPHAGYIYSGAIAGETFAQVRIPPRVIVIGPNHRGVGHPAAVFPSGSWTTPLGEAAIDADLAQRLLSECPGLLADTAAHRFEHSLEVQVPFLQYLNPDVAIVPICLAHLPLTNLLSMGKALGEALARSGEDVLLVASSDMTHYESAEVARRQDRLALDRVLALDPEGLYRTVSEKRISMCGFMPTALMLAAAVEMGAATASLVRYGNSGDVTGDPSEVVGYAGVIVA